MRRIKNMRRTLLIVTLIFAFVLSGCQAVEKESDKIKVYTSFYAMYDFAREIGADKIQLENLVPSGVEPHDYEPATADIVKLENADVFIYSGAGMEGWTDKVISSVKNKELVIVEASEGIELYEDSEDEHNHDGESDAHNHDGENDAHNHDEENDGHNHDGDPHVWLNPQNALLQMQAIKDALCKADSENADYYESNFNACKEKIQKLDNDYKTELAKLNNKSILVSHEAYGYLCSAYGLEQIGIEGILAEGEPSPAKMAKIVDTAKSNNIKYVFSENLGSDKVVQAVANEIDAEVLILNPFEGDIDNKDYFTVMQENLQALIKALS